MKAQIAYTNHTLFGVATKLLLEQGPCLDEHYREPVWENRRGHKDLLHTLIPEKFVRPWMAEHEGGSMDDPIKTLMEMIFENEPADQGENPEAILVPVRMWFMKAFARVDSTLLQSLLMLHDEAVEYLDDEGEGTDEHYELHITNRLLALAHTYDLDHTVLGVKDDLDPSCTIIDLVEAARDADLSPHTVLAVWDPVFGDFAPVTSISNNKEDDFPEWVILQAGTPGD